MSRQRTTTRIANIIRKALSEGHAVDIDGLGSFYPSKDGFDFVPEARPRIFIAYVRDDLRAAQRLFKDLATAGYQPWMDKNNLLPGQNWPRAIEAAIETSDFFIACFSRRSVLKRGVFQSELRFALDCAAARPLDDMFVMPVRLDDCATPQRVASGIQHVDLFPDWDRGLGTLRSAVEFELARKRRAQLPLAS